MPAFLGDCDIWMLPFIQSLQRIDWLTPELQKNDRSWIPWCNFIFSIFTKIRTCFCVLQEAGELYEKGHSRVRLLWRYWRSTLPARGFWFMSLELVLMIVVVCLMRWNRSIAGHWTHTGTYSYWKKTIDWLFWQTLQFLINVITSHDWCPQAGSIYPHIPIRLLPPLLTKIVRKIS